MNMKEAKKKMTQAITAAKDITKALDLKPPVKSIFESEAKGTELTAAMIEFIDLVDAEIIDLAAAMDGEQHLLMPADMKNLDIATTEYLQIILPDEIKARLFTAPEPEKKKPAASKQPRQPGKAMARAEFVAKALTEATDGITKKDLAAKLMEFGDSETESRYQAGIATCYLIAAGFLREEDGKFFIAE